MGDAADDLEFREISRQFRTFCRHGLWKHECSDPNCFDKYGWPIVGDGDE